MTPVQLPPIYSDKITILQNNLQTWLKVENAYNQGPFIATQLNSTQLDVELS